MANERTPFEQRNPQPPSPPLPKTQPRSQGFLLPVSTEGEPVNDVAKNTEFENKPFNRKIRFHFQMQQTFSARKFRNFEYNDLSRMFVFAEISQEEEETFHSLDDIFGILNRSFSLNRKNP